MSSNPRVKKEGDILLEEIEDRCSRSMGMRAHKESLGLKIQSIKHLDNIEKTASYGAKMKGEHNFGSPKIHKPGSNKKIHDNFSLRKIYSNQQVKREIVDGNTLFKLDKRPPLTTKLQEDTYYEEMLATLSNFNRIVNQESRKMLSGYLKASISEVDPTSEQTQKSNILIKGLKEGGDVETSIREYNNFTSKKIASGRI